MGPRAFGGNRDNKALRPGITLYLPVFNEGARFFAGDAHGVQTVNGVKGCHMRLAKADLWPAALFRPETERHTSSRSR